MTGPTPDSIYVTTACFYPTEQPIWRLRKSCEHFGIPLHPYGVGETFVSWRHAKNVRLVEELETIKDRYAYAIYTDGADTWFLDGLERIWEQFEMMLYALEYYGKTVQTIVSGETECYPCAELHNWFPKDGGIYRFPNAGQFFGKTEFLIDKLREIDDAYKKLDDYNDQSYWLRAFADGRMDDVVIDTRATLFHTMSSLGMEFTAETVGNRIYVTDLHAWYAPCAIHFNGGGKEERMQEWWEKMPWS